MSAASAAAVAPVADEAVPYEALAELGQRQLDLLSGDELPDGAELLALLQERRELLATMPATPPQSAAAALARAKAINDRITAELARHASAARRALSHVEQGRRAARGYGADSSRPRGMSWNV
ncbi:MAG TPA: hypothetical protein VGM91_18820 [Conexibacter sp.]|jgi:hypothetical protein